MSDMNPVGRDPRYDPKPGDIVIFDGQEQIVQVVTGDGTVYFTPLVRAMTLNLWRQNAQFMPIVHREEN